MPVVIWFRRARVRVRHRGPVDDNLDYFVHRRLHVTVVDKTPLTKENVTETGLRGIGKEETRCKTKGGRKEYMLSGDVKMDGTNQFACRLISRGDGWWTISERSLTDESGKYLRERNILRAPGKKDVVVDRYFERSK